VTDICTLYREAPALAEQGERVLSTDEMTGVQALERKEPNLPLVPGTVERREFEYIRHGTRTFILNRDVVTGAIIAPSDGPPAPKRTSWHTFSTPSPPIPPPPAGTSWSITSISIAPSPWCASWRLTLG